MEVYTVKLSSKEFTSMRVALALAGSKIVEQQDKAQEEGDRERVLTLEIARLENNNCHMALDHAVKEDVDNG